MHSSQISLCKKFHYNHIKSSVTIPLQYSCQTSSTENNNITSAIAELHSNQCKCSTALYQFHCRTAF